MNEHPKDEIKLRPILARNMTARADYLVPGNPMIARPESGVGNAHPGLEFDVRALDRHFLPGLVFDFQYGAGAKLVGVDPQRLGTNNPGLAAGDVAQEPFLWAVRARFGDEPEKVKTVRLIGIDGYMVLRRIMDLEPGPLTVVVGRLPQTVADRRKIDEVLAALHGEPGIAAIERSDGNLVYARVEGERAAYLDADGVIDPALIPPGEITHNLCSPWQWDFADCYCFYWASSKPDIVVGITGETQVLNFQRDRTAREPARPAATSREWRAGNMSEADLIVHWTDLPIVTSEREGVVPRRPRWPKIENRMCLEDITHALPALASVEHALCVEYLFARYSIRAPREASRWLRGAKLARYQSAREIFSIAIDEMRHFRWANEALILLGGAPCLARADVIGRDLRRSFQRRPLTPQVLDEFIGIEAPSSVFNDDPQQLDGMYTRVLVSLHELALELEGRGETVDTKQMDTLRRLTQLVKVIIDEGENHWERFRRVKERLSGSKPESYLRFMTTPKPAPQEPWSTLEALCDAYYDVLLQALYVTFCLGRLSRGEWLSIARCVMFALDDAAYHLAEGGYGPQFKLPDWCKLPPHAAVPPAFAGTAPHGTQRYGGPRHLRELIKGEDTVDRMLSTAFALVDRLDTNATRRLRRVGPEHRRHLERLRGLIIKEYRKGGDGR